MADPRIIHVPEFDFTGGFYFPQLFELLVRHLRSEVPELSNESEGEVAIQIMAAFALVGHLNNTLLDVVAFESLMVTAQLRDSLVAHLKLIGFEVEGDVPAEVELVVTLSKTFTTTEEVIPAGATFGTKRKSFAEPRVYEALSPVSVDRTDRVGQVWVFDESTGTYTDRTTEVNTDLSPFDLLPAVPAPGDALYIIHSSAMTNRVRVVDVSVPMADVFGVWEYSDDSVTDEFPDAVVNLGSTLQLEIDSLLNTDGTINHAGLEVVVTLNSTGAQETLISTYTGTNNVITTTGFLGQTMPSTDIEDYTVGTLWHRLPGLDDETNLGNTSFEDAGDVDFTLPKSQVRDWQPIDVNGFEGFALRFRVVTVGGAPVPPTVDRLLWNKRNNFVQTPTTQGRTRTNETLGNSDGTASQAFTLGSANVIPGSVRVFVDGDEWSEVDNFLSSNSSDEHFTVEIDSDGIGTVTFGDGVTGRIPPSGVNNIVATYRIEAHLDGNVGADTIQVNRSGVAFVKGVTNPKPAAGWVQRRGATATDRERLKLEGPASLRTLGRAVTVADIEFLTVEFNTADGSAPFVRAKAIEFGFGDKTVKVVTVGAAGATTSPFDRAELETYFNGDPDTGESGVMVANQRVFARDYVPVTIDVEATITGGNQESIETALEGLLSPVAVLEDGITYRWEFGQDVTRSKIIATIFDADSNVEDVVLVQPAANVVLDEDELPSLGTLTLTVI